MNKLIFYNHFNNGDLHICRSFIKKISHHLNNYALYINHRRNLNVLNDIYYQCDQNFLNDIDIYSGHSLYDGYQCNTWYASNNHKYINQYGISFDCLYSLFDDFMIHNFNISLNDIDPNLNNWFPSIDYSFFEIKNIDIWLKNHIKPKILVVNAHAKSGQSDNFIMCPLINFLSKKLPSHDIIYTNLEYDQHEQIHFPEKTDNVFFSGDIIGNLECDLNEIGYLSSYCDLIIGRATGPFTFAFNKENLFEKKNKMIVISNLINETCPKFWLSHKFKDKIEYYSKITNINACNVDDLIKVVERNL